MPDANALTYLNLQDAVLGRRFPAASQRPNAKRWLATAYADVWTALRGDGSLWDFEIVSLSALAVTAGDSTPTMPADYADTLALYTEDGTPVVRLGREDFEAVAVSPNAAGTPLFFTVANRAITLAPAPSGNATFKHTYRRRLAHKESDGVTVTAGYFDEDTDYPLWDDHHSILIPRATAIGLLELNDPTWQESQGEYERQLARMREDYELTRPQTQWPLDPR